MAKPTAELTRLSQYNTSSADVPYTFIGPDGYGYEDEWPAALNDTATVINWVADNFSGAVDAATVGVRWITQRIRVRSTTNINLANGLENGDTINGVTLATGEHVFLGSQTNPAENGLYTVVASGVASRAAFANTADELSLIGFLIREGSAGAGERWMLSMKAADIAVGTTALAFSQIGVEMSTTRMVTDVTEIPDDGGGNTPSVTLRHVTSDNVDGGGGFIIGDQNRYIFGGSNVKGGRIAGYDFIANTAATSASNLQRNYAARSSIAYTEVGDGGTNLGAGARGAYFAGNWIVHFGAGASNIFHGCGGEIDVHIEAGVTVKYVTGAHIVAYNKDASGADIDAALSFSSTQLTDEPFSSIISLNDISGKSPLKDTGAVIDSHWTGGGTKPLGKGIDLSGFAITGNAYESTGFAVDGDGKITGNGQIVFPAVQNASADPNTLDDYEEGTWTPTLTFSTPGDLSVGYVTQVGRYTKIGRKVTVHFDISVNVFSWTTASGGLRIAGLPFACGHSAAVGSLIFGGINKAGYSQVCARVTSGNTFMLLVTSGMGVAASNVQAADAPSGNSVFAQGTLCYEV